MPNQPSDHSPLVSVVLVYGGKSPVFGACLEGLAAQEYPACDVLIINNAPQHDVTDEVRRILPASTIITNPTNLGFAKAVNQGWRAAAGEFIATLNDDAIPEPLWLRHLVDAMIPHPQVGSCTSTVVFSDRPNVINSAGIAIDRAGIMWDWRGGEADDLGRQREPVDVFGACAAAALYRRTMIEELDGFAEDYFAYLEDVDLAWRARLRGWRCLYVPAARVSHLHSASSRDRPSFKNYLLARNKVWTLLRDYPLPQLAVYVPIILLYDALFVAYRLLAEGDASALRGRLAALGAVRRCLRERRRIQRSATPEGRRATWALMAPLTSPLAVRRRYAHLIHLPPPSPAGDGSPASGPSGSS